METKDQPVLDWAKEHANRVRKDGKPLFAEKLDRANAVLKKGGLPPEVAKKK